MTSLNLGFKARQDDDLLKWAKFQIYSTDNHFFSSNEILKNIFEVAATFETSASNFVQMQN